MTSRLAERLGVSEGQVYTLGLGFIVAVALLLAGIPPVLRADAPFAIAPITPPPAIGTEFDTATTVPSPGDAALPVEFPIVPALPPGVSQTTPTATTTTTTTPAPRSTGTLAVAIGRWTSAPETAAAGHRTVPRGGLPVGSLVGRDDTRSYVLLSGAGATLRLALSDEPGAQQLPGVASVRACPITQSPWSVTDGETHDTGPAFDTARCVDGVAAADGATWSFDLSRFSAAQRTGSAGFALVPGDNQVPFQVVFESES